MLISVYIIIFDYTLIASLLRLHDFRCYGRQAYLIVFFEYA